MIQRIQTLWLVLAAACAALSFKFSFYSGNKIGTNNLPSLQQLVASSTFFLLVLAVILMYKNRKQQLWLTVSTLLVSLVNLGVYFSQIKNYSNGTLSFTAILVFAIPVFLALAIRGIWQDEKLVKSVDRIR
jgi:drug/metabolite transporter (DMT)-like permease